MGDGLRRFIAGSTLTDIVQENGDVLKLVLCVVLFFVGVALLQGLRVGGGWDFYCLT